MTRGLPPPQGLAAIPASIFYSMPHRKHFDHYVRFCFVKVKDRGLEGREGLLKLPVAPWCCGERGRTDRCWCRMSPRSRPWTRSCRDGRLSSGPDVAVRPDPTWLLRALCPGVSPSRVGHTWSWGAPFSATQDVPGEEPCFVVLVDSGALPTVPVVVSRWCGGPDLGLPLLLARLGHRVLGPLCVLPRFTS